jgi:exopolysaccharide biosynthesis polyprenyl glycosylphosphotransferase
VSSSERLARPGSFQVDADLTEQLLAPRRHTRVRRVTLVRRALVTADIVAVALALGAGAFVGRHRGLNITIRELLVFVGIIGIWLAVARLYGLYDKDERQPDHTTFDDLAPIFNAVTVGTWIGVLAVGLDGHHWNLKAALTVWGTALVALPTARATARAVARRRSDFIQNAIIVGAGDVGQLVGRKLRQHPEFGIRLVGFVDSDPKKLRLDLDGVPMLGRAEDIVEVVRANDVQRVVVAFSNDSHDTLLDLVRSLRDLDVEIDVVPRLFEAVGPAVGIHAVEGLALVGLRTARPSRAARAVKRTFDVVLAFTLMTLASPLFLWIAFRIRRDSPGPIFFRQERLGMQQRPFTVLKFRTMTQDADDRPHREYVAAIMDTRATPTENSLYKLDRPDAVTRVGAWLRRTSLDELPQLINVLRGDMSLVGPRPCLEYETKLFDLHHFDRFLVPAGMTGLWQVEARARSTFREALDLDAAYARNWSLMLDLWLLIRTPTVLLRSRRSTR